MRAGRRRRRLRAVDRGRGGGRDPSARLRLETGRERRGGGAAQPHRPRGRRLVARVLRSCACRLADAGDGFAVRGAGKRAAPLSRSLRAGDRPQSWRAGRAVRTGFARPQPAFGRGRAQRRVARRDRARGGSARRRGRRGAARLRAPARRPHRRRARRFVALSLGEARASRRDRSHDRQRPGARRRKTAIGRACATTAAATPPPAARSSGRIFPIFWSGTGRNRRRPPPPRPASRRR